MSVINQVLSDLEKRGVNALPNEPAIRPVPPQRNWLKPALLVATLLAVALLLAMQWQYSYQSRPAPSSVEALPSSKTVNAATVANTSAALASAAPVIRSPSEPVLAAEPSPASAPEGNMQQEGAMAAPAMRMSSELSAMPVPSSLRRQTLAATATLSNSSHFASPVPPALPDSASSKAIAEARQRSLADIPAKGTAATALPVSAVPAGSVDKQVKQLSVQQQADNEFRLANEHLQQGHTNEALAGYEAALQLNPSHDAARQTAVGLLLKNRRGAEAEQILQQGLERNPANGNFAMLLARLQVERNAVQTGLDTLLKALPHVGQQPDYQAFVAALLQRLDRHQDAIAHYRIALQQSPGSGIWLMGLGISLQALQRNEEARDAFKHSLESRTLNAELQAFVRQRMQEL